MHTHLPVSLWDFCDWRLEAVGVESFVTAVTEQHRVLVILALADLACCAQNLHDIMQLARAFGHLLLVVTFTLIFIKLHELL